MPGSNSGQLIFFGILRPNPHLSPPWNCTQKSHMIITITIYVQAPHRLLPVRRILNTSIPARADPFTALSQGLGILHRQYSAVYIQAIELFLGGLGRFYGIHLDKSEPLRLPDGSIRYQIARLYRADSGKQTTDFIAGCRGC